MTISTVELVEALIDSDHWFNVSSLDYDPCLYLQCDRNTRWVSEKNTISERYCTSHVLEIVRTRLELAARTKHCSLENPNNIHLHGPVDVEYECSGETRLLCRDCFDMVLKHVRIAHNCFFHNDECDQATWSLVYPDLKEV